MCVTALTGLPVCSVAKASGYCSKPLALYLESQTHNYSYNHNYDMNSWATESLQEVFALFVQLKFNLALSESRGKAPCYLWLQYSTGPCCCILLKAENF